MELLEIYNGLLREFGPQGWWPVGGSYHKGLPRGEGQKWEVCVGAILTQNTSWKNVEKAMENLRNAGIMDSGSFLKISKRRLSSLIRPSGYYNQKAIKLKEFSRVVKGFGGVGNFLEKVKRNELLEVWGIGPETADSILLYAGGREEFVVDMYTKSIFSRLGLIGGGWDYHRTKDFFQKKIPRDKNIYKEFHALIVELAKRNCRKRPVCRECLLRGACRHALDEKKKAGDSI